MLLFAALLRSCEMRSDILFMLCFDLILVRLRMVGRRVENSLSHVFLNFSQLAFCMSHVGLTGREEVGAIGDSHVHVRGE